MIIINEEVKNVEQEEKITLPIFDKEPNSNVEMLFT
jgi:hypothetical protein